MTIDVRSVPVVGDNAWFVACEEERGRAREEAQTSTDDAIRFEATMVVTQLLRSQGQSVSGLVRQIEERISSYDPRRNAALDSLSATTSWSVTRRATRRRAAEGILGPECCD